MSAVDLLLTGFSEIATLVDGTTPRRGEAMAELTRIPRAAVAIDRGRVVAVGPERRLRREYRCRSGGAARDAGGAVAVPGFVDAHTHLLFGGDRAHEVALKIRGLSYADIARRGGGIYSTVRATRAASDGALLTSALARVRRLLAGGTTSVEVKSGYALDHRGELRLLRLLPRLSRRSGVTVVPTYLGAHARPPGRARGSVRYVDEIVERTLPEVARQHLARFCDVFCEPGFFSVPEASRILRAAGRLGLGLKVHAEEFAWSGGARLAAKLSVHSAEHLLQATADDRERLARAGVVATLLPVTPFASMSGDRPVGRAFVDAGVPVALGSDLSPNSWVESMPVVLAHAVYGGRLTPAEAITAATVNAAHAVGLGEAAGTIAPGRSADLAVFDVPTVEHIAYRVGTIPERVYRQGKPVSSA
jgi:imidazolonepropionase